MLDLLSYIISEDAADEMADAAEAVLLRAVAEAGWQERGTGAGRSE
jgi:hypothetical protein